MSDYAMITRAGHLPDCLGKVVVAIVRHQLLDKLLARNFQRDHTSRPLQFLSRQLGSRREENSLPSSSIPPRMLYT